MDHALLVQAVLSWSDVCKKLWATRHKIIGWGIFGIPQVQSVYFDVLHVGEWVLTVQLIKKGHMTSL